MINVYRCAADIIETNGWCQGDYYPYPGPGDLFEEPEQIREHILANNSPCCAIGAIYAAGGGEEEVDWLADYLDEPLVHVWNDRVDRTKVEVVAALHGAAVTVGDRP